MAEPPRWTPLGRALGWVFVVAMALWPWVVAFMIAYAPEESGLDFEPSLAVFWMGLAAAGVAGLGAWRAAQCGTSAHGGRRAAAWTGSALLGASALHHAVFGAVALLFLSGAFW